MNHRNQNELSRRHILRGMGALAAAAALPAIGRAQPVEPAGAGAVAAGRKRSLRIAHLTDTHIQPERDAVAGVAACLHHVQSQADKPQLILTGGDHVMDAFGQPFDRAQLQWNLLNKTFKDENSIPVKYCLGNHDVWGWDKKESKTKGDEKGWGKTMALDQLTMPTAHHSFDQAGWHIVVIDSVQTDSDDPSGYVGGLDDAQFEWLKADLEAHTNTPTLVLTHIPILTVTVLDKKPEKGGDMKVSGGLIFTDFARVKNLFLKNPQVKSVISGHMHRLDRVDFLGVTHYCNGAVSANWWKGKHHEVSEGYALVDLYDDGTVERAYVEYGWKAKG